MNMLARKLPMLALLALLALFLPAPASAQEVGSRAMDATILLRSGSFGASMNTATTYIFSEATPGHWIARAGTEPLGEQVWKVTAAPMGGPRAGYITFTNGEGKTTVVDVLTIDACYGIAGEERIGW